jgi:hypothetical protein
MVPSSLLQSGRAAAPTPHRPRGTRRCSHRYTHQARINVHGHRYTRTGTHAQVYTHRNTRRQTHSSTRTWACRDTRPCARTCSKRTHPCTRAGLVAVSALCPVLVPCTRAPDLCSGQGLCLRL